MEYLKLFNKIIEEIFSKRDIDSLLEVSVKRITEILEAGRATFYFFNEETQELWSSVATELEISEIRVPLGKGIAGRAALNKKLINVENAYKCPFFNRKVDKKTGFRTETVLCNPLLYRVNKLLGVIQVINKRKGCFTKDDEDILKSISVYITIAIDNIKLLQEQETLFRSTLYALAGAIDAKDPVTSGHSHRVAYFSVKIARELGFFEEEVKIVEYAAYLHDVGKIGIPDNLLSKKGKLTPEEYGLVKKHPLYTLQILKNIIFSEDTKKIPLVAAYHHEFLDGSGYPFGLKGKQIHIFSRIITIADIYDAMSSFDRPYKKALSAEKALRVLKEEAKKKHLDKKIMNIFIKKGLYKYERRRYRRIGLDAVISYKIIPHKKMLKEKIRDKEGFSPYDLNILKQEKSNTLNISEGGVLFLSKSYLPMGIYLDLEIVIFLKKIICIGKVVWTERIIGTANYRVGVSFVNISHHARQLLSKQLIRLGRQVKNRRRFST